MTRPLRQLARESLVVASALCLSATGLAAQDVHVAPTLGTHIGGFMDVFYRDATGPNAKSGFGLGQFDTYISSRISDKVFFLSEVVFEYGADWGVDVERVVLTYAAKSYFQIAAGKHHTPFGYWNNAYHHGTVLQPTVDRPDLLRFEDDGGPLAIHTTGLLVTGRDFSAWHLGYDVLLGNGIGSTPKEDNDPSKSLTVAVHAQATSDLRIGASLYLDHVSMGTPTLAGTKLGGSMAQQMFGGFVAYTGSDVEVLTEFQHIVNRVGTAASHGTDGGYFYIGRRIGDLVPYARYDAVSYGTGDPYFSGDNVQTALVGARYDLAPAATLKLELRRRRTDSGGTVSQFAAHFAIGF